MFKSVNVVYNYVSDLARAKKFYGETLAWPVAFGADEMGWFEFGQQGSTTVAINLWRDTSKPLPIRVGGMVLSVDDAHAVTAALKQKGIKVEEVTEIPNAVRLGAFYDPDGNRIEIAQSLA
jgi:predicted enzyme related to lactoylglutathione lyase